MTTLGCKVNQYDGRAVAAALRRAGLTPVGQDAGNGARPDLLVVNTCCVTATAMRKSRQAIRRAVRGAPGAAVLVVGCYSDYDGRRIAELLASLGVGARRAAVAGHHDDLAACLQEVVARLRPRRPACGKTDGRDYRANYMGNDVCIDARSGRCEASPDSIIARRARAVRGGAPGAARLGPIDRCEGRQRAFVKVQDGCDAFCAYCIVPYTRPRVWSRPLEQIETECRTLVAAGHREIVLCGVFLGAFGRATAVRRRWAGAPSGLVELLRRVAGIEGLWRVRLSSLEPGDLTDELLALYRSLPNVAPHLHLPLQSGSARLLRRMNRQYTPDRYRRTVDRIRAVLDRPAITTDVIVGFPSETDRDFADTLALARHAGFAKIHAFPFSAIRGTAAWARRKQAPPAPVVKRRMGALAELEKATARAYRGQFVGQTLEGLVEGPRPGSPGRRRGKPGDDGTRTAMTDRYITVRFAAGAAGELTGQVVRLAIDAVTPEGLAGRLMPS